MEVRFGSSRTMRVPALVAVLVAVLMTPVAPARAQQERIDAQTVARIRDEGLQRSRVMDHIVWLSDIHGPRLTGSPAFEAAGEWAMSAMRSWGLANVHQERFAFGKGWALERFSAHMVEPQIQPIIGMPKAWSSSTRGVVSGDVVRVSIMGAEDFARYRGTLRGKIVLTQPARPVRMLDGRVVLRMTDDEIREAMTPPPARGGGAGGRGAAPAGGGGRGGRGSGGPSLAEQTQEFWRTEGVLAILDRGANADSSLGGSDLSWYTQRTDGGTIFVQSGGTRDSTAGRDVPTVTLAVEHYNRMVRILERNVPVKMELEVRTRFYDEGATPRGFNIVAELPGSDPALRDEFVLLGAHFDSWHGGTGATDNATGSAAMMEALRILKAAGVTPRRTIRIGLWGAEENGLLGSREYARQHFGDATTMQLKPAHAKISAYFNIDNGTGKIRGIWTQGNAAVQPVFTALTAPLRDLGVDIISPRSVGSTDHSSFDALGIPAFQFVQERYEYNSRTHHSTMDVVDRVQADDMKQMATVVAVLAYLTAQRDDLLPRKPLPAGRGSQAPQ